MIPRFHSALWLLLCALAACTGARCDNGNKTPAVERSPANAGPKPDLRVLLLTDPRGYLEPCGCQKRPLGGLDKLATVVEKLKRDDIPMLLVGAGEFAFGSELRPEDAAGARMQEIWRAEKFVEIWKALGATAVTPGALDLAQPVEQLGKLSALGAFPWLIDNAKVAAESSPFAQARVVDVKGVKVGLLGLVAGDTAHPADPAITLAAELPALAEQKVRELRSAGAQLVIALVSADRRTARMIAGKGPDLVVMGGLDTEQALAPAVHGEAVLLHAGRQGQHVVAVDLGLASGGAWEDASAWTRREASKDLDAQLSELRARIVEWEKDDKVQKGDLEAQRARLGELERQREVTSEPSYKGRWFRAELTELSPDVAGDEAVAEALNAHDRRVNEHNRVSLADRKPVPAKAGEASYAGSASCASCHKEAYAWWQATAHGNAYATLEKVHKQYNLNCVSCHVTGYNQPGGSTVTHVESLKNVGCENCHGPGSLHNAEPNKPGLIARDAPENVCASCHTREHSDHFVYSSYRAMQIVPGHGLPSVRQ
jgi:2',3'-cyclic-nucleotide 2'-phosphodiesterase (5'-nucleotidase family)